MADLDAAIDDLYRLPLDEFTRARNALAKTLEGKDKARVAGLTKPSVPMWAINQLHWQDRPAYNALVDASEKLRAAHKAVLTGRQGDVRKAEELHRTTLEKAVARTIALAEKANVRLTEPVRDAVRRTLAALPTEESPGRLTREPPPAGFSLLTGIKPVAAPSAPRARRTNAPAPAKIDRKEQLVLDRLKREAEKRARREEAQAKREAERRRRAEEQRAREIARAEQALRDAERRLARLKTT